MKNTLLYYQGGGYDGCIWEWNFCFWGVDGIWHNLHSTGCGGVESEKQALELAETLEHKAELVDLTDVTRFRQFQQDNNASLVLGIAHELNENYNYTLEIVCAECGCSFVADCSENDTAINNSDIVCYECLASGICDCCNEYMGEDELNDCDEDGDDDVRAELAELGYYRVCNDCFEYNKEEFERVNLEDLRFQAFCTGNPDIFSKELRDYWI